MTKKGALQMYEKVSGINLNGEFSKGVLNFIFVFNEDFIENNVRLQPDGLERIVMFGEQAEVAIKKLLIELNEETVLL